MRFQSDSNIITLAAALLLATACKPKPPPDDGQIHALYPMRAFLSESEVIVEAVVEGRDGDTVLFKVGTALKGTCPAARLRLKTIPTAGFLKGECGQVLRHLPPGSPVVVFSAGSAMELYINRFFVQAYGTWGNGSKDGEWGYGYLETRNNRTWRGSVEELRALIPQVLEGRAKSPPAMSELPPIDVDALQGLPLPGEPVDEEYLPAAFRRGRPEPFQPRQPENPLDVVPGLRYQVFPEVDPSVSLDSLAPLESGDVAGPEAAPAKAGTLRLRGYLDIPADGEYFLILRSQKGGELSLNGHSLVPHEGGKAPLERGADVALKAGRHEIAIVARGPFQVLWSGPGIPRQPLPADRCFRGK